MPSPPTLYFILPGANRSGGVRVTIEMANRLLDRGYQTALVIRRPRLSGTQRLTKPLTKLIKASRHDWLHECRCPVTYYNDISEIPFEQGSTAIGVGTFTVEDLEQTPAFLNKIRFNHGIPSNRTELIQQAWSGPMPTLTVSATIVEPLKELGCTGPIHVVPNGIKTEDYYPADVTRDGIGTIYSAHYNKHPEAIVQCLNKLRAQLPDTPIRVFGAERKPKELTGFEYHHLPSVEKARELYSQSKVWMLASRIEGLPGPVLEAMACGTAVASTDNLGSLEIIEHDVNGLISPVDDVDALVSNIASVCTDDALRQRLVAGGFETCKRFTWDAAVDRMVETLNKIESISTQDKVKTTC